MKSAFSKFMTVIRIAFAAVVVGAMFIGCSPSAAERKPVVVTSYVSTDSEVLGSTVEVVEKVANTVVEIRTDIITTQWGMQYISSGAGSGVIVGRDAGSSAYYIVTNNHVIDGASKIEVTLRSGETYEASLVATDVAGDIAVVRITEEASLNMAVWANSDALKVGEDMIAIGNPLGSLGGTVTKGILSATERSIAVGDYTMTLLQTDTAINPGNSGGGLFNMRGELVGIVNAKTSDEEVEGICFAIPSNTAKHLYDELLTNGVVTGRVTLGVNVAKATETVYVTELLDIEGSDNSHKDKFTQYDKIAKINGKEITSMLDYNNALAALKPGDSVEIEAYHGTISRDFFGRLEISFSKTPVTFTVTAMQLPASAQ